MGMGLVMTWVGHGLGLYGHGLCVGTAMIGLDTDWAWVRS